MELRRQVLSQYPGFLWSLDGLLKLSISFSPSGEYEYRKYNPCDDFFLKNENALGFLWLQDLEIQLRLA